MTIEISNTTPLPARIYANEGICQFLFLQGAGPVRDQLCGQGRQVYGAAWGGDAENVASTRVDEAELQAMDQFRIRGGQPLHGEIPISGAKNSALKLLVASMLTSERVVLSNMPRIADIGTMRLLLEQHGIAVEDVDGTGGVLSVGGDITNTEAPYDIVSKMRASILVLGPLLARAREARVSLPGGCAIGTRPVDMHLRRSKRWAPRSASRPAILMRAPRAGLIGAKVVLPFASVGATEKPPDGGDARRRTHRDRQRCPRT